MQKTFQPILVRNGRVIDPANHVDAVCDLRLDGGKIEALGPCGSLPVTPGTREIDAKAMLVLPGLVDTHTHYLQEDVAGYNMLIAAGVTTALDACLSNPQVPAALARRPIGLNALFLYCLMPGRNISSTSPDDDELRTAMQSGMARGAFGIKIIGGHIPLTPEATARAIAVAAELGYPITVHAGSTTTPDDLSGMLELCELAGNNPLHMPHINSYCTGAIMDGDVLSEAAAAARALRAHPRIVSESHLSPYSCVGASMNAEDKPGSLFLASAIRRLGYSADYAGLGRAIADGKVLVSGPRDGCFVFYSAKEGLERYEANHARVTVAFPFQHVGMAAALASARRADGEFVITALATDGGVIPRNYTLERGLALVEAGIFTLAELVEKSCWAPARMLGLEASKGHLAPGADADVAIVDPMRRAARTVIAGGVRVFEQGVFEEAPNRLHSLIAGNFGGFATENLFPYWVNARA
ncbi:MAG: amidohydrolase family protein [Oligosphaeraceae bacterium]|nr:amidohydrolase family protein [Oligosphaeraceae bacterium]